MSDSPINAEAIPGTQGSIEWLMERVGFCTASRFKDVMDFTKAGKAGAKRSAYLWEVVIERITGKPVQHYESAAMMHGTEYEPMARMAYEARTGSMVTETGFHKHPTLQWVGGSPDGYVDDDGGIEIKCPFNSANHLQTIMNGMPEDHMAQVQGLMWISGRQWWDFISYDPRMPENLQLYSQRIARDDKFIAELEAAVIAFLAEVDAIVAKLQEAAK